MTVHVHEPAFFKDTLFAVDRLYWRSQVACAFSYNISGFFSLDSSAHKQQSTALAGCRHWQMFAPS